jgi:hypothetical protein
VKINTSAYPESIGGSDALTVSWSHRDRQLQTAGTLQDTTETDIGPEAGTTYTLRIYDEDDTLIRTYSGITGTSQTYPTATEESDSSHGRLNGSLRIELESVRDSLTSHQHHDITVLREGYGFNYGKLYGGSA